jgi:ATP-dependent exoDNAse (exonuclease V) beta subunit
VGDPKQSIYRFRRAEPQVFQAAITFVQEQLGGAVLRCDHTRRNAPAVLDCVNRTLRVEKQLRRIPPAFRGEGERSTRLTDPKAQSARTIPLPEFVHAALHERIELVTAQRKASKVYAAPGSAPSVTVMVSTIDAA